jgi:hypothetical protein
MTIEQTTQLVQLILNAALMVVAAGLMLAVATLHQLRLETRRASASAPQRSLRKILRRQTRQIRRSIFYLNVACLLLISSTGFLALRTLINQSTLISLSLGCFAIGCLVFLIGVGFFLMSVMKRSNSRLGKSSTLKSKLGAELGAKLAQSRIRTLDVSTAPSNLVILRDRVAR